MGEQGRLLAGRYRLEERIGAGGMGVVWRAVDETLRRTVAVKQLIVQSGGGGEEALEQARSRAMREGRIAARFTHPNAVTVFDVVDEDDTPWLVLEYVPCTTLGAELSRQRALPPKEVARIGSSVASALAVAHDAGIVHRDIKPGNVLLAHNGDVKITDFGISRAAGDVVVTATGLVSGTPAYLAPEVAKGDNPSPATDVFSLGATLYAALEGQPPFGNAENPLAVLYAVAAGKIKPPATQGPVTDVVLRLLSVNPDDRPTMREASEALAHAAGRTAQAVIPTVRMPPKPITPLPSAPASPPPAPVPAPAPSTAVERLSGPRGRGRLPGLLVAVGAVVVIAAVAAVLLFTDIGRKPGQDRADRTNVAARQVPATTENPPDTTRPTLTEMRHLLTTYYGLLPTDTQRAYTMVTGQARGKGYGSFQEFYGTLAAVNVHDITAAGQGRVTAVVDFTERSGATSHELYRFTIVRKDGKLLIDNAVRLGAAPNS